MRGQLVEAQCSLLLASCLLKTEPISSLPVVGSHCIVYVSLVHTDGRMDGFRVCIGDVSEEVCAGGGQGKERREGSQHGEASSECCTPHGARG